ncbi:MAG: DUF1698 domain-containing protein [Gammaproteobacteria bacterium]
MRSSAGACPGNSTMDRQARIGSQNWSHAIDLGGGVVTPGRFGRDVPPNYTLYGVFELLRRLRLDEARCVDVGTMDGLVAFVMKALGAREVTACDLARRPGFEIVRDELGLDVDYRFPVDAARLPDQLGPAAADLVVMAGVLYHVLEPMNLLLACRRALRREGFLLLETTYLFDSAAPVMSFNPIDTSSRQFDNPNVFWRPTRQTVHGMLRLAGFSIVSSIAVDARLAILAQAKRPSEIPGRSGLMIASQERYRSRFYTDTGRFDVLEADDSAPASISRDGTPEDRFLYRALYVPNVPYQPAWRPDSAAVKVRDLARSARIHARGGLAASRAAATHAATGLLGRLVARSRRLV